MFTGLIETIGAIKRMTAAPPVKSFEVGCQFEGNALRSGESISVDGVCVTAERIGPGGFHFVASPETLQRSIFTEKRVGDQVHLERALRMGDRMGCRGSRAAVAAGTRTAGRL